MDGKIINQSNVKLWHNQVGYVPQEVVIFDGTILENIVFGIPANKWNEKKVWEVLESVNLEKHFRDLPTGLRTQIGERGRFISGGQKNRIGLARALIGNYDLIILDETLSALDSNNVNHLLESINKRYKNTTFIIISHTNESLKTCNKIVTLQ